jgi:alkylhydroperoxidase family enzyme
VGGHFPARELPGVTATAILPPMQLTIHTQHTAPEASKPILEGIARDLGLVPNMAATIASSPTLLFAFDGLRRAVGSGELDPRAREVAGVAVGVAVDNHYGVAFHSTVLGRLGVDEAEIERMRGGEPPHDEKLAAAYELARAIAVGRGVVADNVVTRAQAAGYSTAEILEIVAECTFAGLVGVMDNLAGRVTLDEFLAPRAWG